MTILASSEQKCIQHMESQKSASQCDYLVKETCCYVMQDIVGQQKKPPGRLTFFT